jgi:hypothetical protein
MLDGHLITNAACRWLVSGYYNRVWTKKIAKQFPQVSNTLEIAPARKAIDEMLNKELLELHESSRNINIYKTRRVIIT